MQAGAELRTVPHIKTRLNLHQTSSPAVQSAASHVPNQVMPILACRFASAAGKLSLQRVLRAYAVYDTEVGYCQVSSPPKHGSQEWTEAELGQPKTMCYTPTSICPYHCCNAVSSYLQQRTSLVRIKHHSWTAVAFP